MILCKQLSTIFNFFQPQEWISSRGSSTSLEQLADSCYRSLQQMDPELLTDLKSKVTAAIEGSNNSQMKEIRGLGKIFDCSYSGDQNTELVWHKVLLLSCHVTFTWHMLKAL